MCHCYNRETFGSVQGGVFPGNINGQQVIILYPF